MNALSAWFTRNPVAANLLMGLIIIGGVFTLWSMRIEGFPALPASSVSVTTYYPGASAQQVDEGVSRKIEKALEGMPGIKKITSYSDAEFSTVWIQKTSQTKMDRFQQDVSTRVQSIPSLPQMAERPIITRDDVDIESLLVQVHGTTDTNTLQQFARTVRDELLAQPEIARLEPFGLLPHEMRIETDPDRMRAYHLTPQDIALAVTQSSLDYRTGLLDSDTGRIVVKADSRALDIAAIEALPLITTPSGSQVRIADVATVIDTFVETYQFARFQGNPSVGIMVYTGRKGHLMEVSDAAHRVVTRLQTQLPAGLAMDIWGEYSTYMKDRLSLLATNAWQGLLIVFVLLALFLDLRLAFWVAMGIPISIAGTLMIMGDRFLGYSLNDITTFGMIIVLGILVDDAIIVGESIFQSRREISDAQEGTIRGVKRVATATVFGAFTTIAAFYPLLLIDNDLGKIFASFAVVVIVSLLVSLVESKLILPAHLAEIKLNTTRPRRGPSAIWHRIHTACVTGLEWINQHIYQPLLSRLLTYRYAALILFLTVAITGMAVVGRGWIRTVFFPEVPGRIITVNLRMNSGSSAALTRQNLDHIETAAKAVNHEAQAHATSTDPAPPIAKIMTALTGHGTAEIYAELQPEAKCILDTQTVLERWRNAVGTLEGVDELTFSGSFETGGGFIVELGSRDPSILGDAVAAFSHRMAAIPGVLNVRDDYRTGNPQIRLTLKPEAVHLGLRASDLAVQMGDAFGGAEVQRLQRGSEEVKVIVKTARQRRQYMDDILNSTVLTPDGRWVPVTAIARIETNYVPSAIHRQNGQRVVQVRATLDKDQISASELFAQVKSTLVPELTAAYPTLSIKGAGELEEITLMKGGLKRALIIILLLIYALLAAPLKSYWQPLVIMSVIPFGFVGAITGHWIMGYPLSVLSFFGMLAVTGVVVNDSLVMLTRFNELRQAGTPLKQALLEVGSSRFRAIFLTTVTTVCGLMPLLSETSEQAQYLIPAAISLAWGELLATPVTLMLVPVVLGVTSRVVDGREVDSG